MVRPRPLLSRLRAALAARGRGRMRRWRVLAPAGLVLAACVAVQAVAITHELGPEGHPAGEACALCVSLGTLGAADVAGTSAHVTAAAHEAAASPGTPRPAAAPRVAHRARAPPVAS